jgi:hypothetical protein
MAGGPKGRCGAGAGRRSRARLLIALARAGEWEIIAARVGRFYGEGYRWAAGLPLSELLRKARLIAEVERRENVR